MDVGCGVGRMAMPLAKYLNDKGSYKGFDIAPRAVNWCKAKIAKNLPNFDFDLADIYNAQYNPNGSYKVSEYKFPYDDLAFDFVFLTSVFTHMLPAGVENYFSEISRVLKPKGRCLITFFLINPESAGLIDLKKSTQEFIYDCTIYRTVDKNKPEVAVAYAEDYIRGLFSKNGLISHC